MSSLGHIHRYLLPDFIRQRQLIPEGGQETCILRERGRLDSGPHKTEVRFGAGVSHTFCGYTVIVLPSGSSPVRVDAHGYTDALAAAARAVRIDADNQMWCERAARVGLIAAFMFHWYLLYLDAYSIHLGFACLQSDGTRDLEWTCATWVLHCHLYCSGHSILPAF
jgi:hypothetical protein